MHTLLPDRLQTSWCRSPAEVTEAQRLRYDVFVTEMGADLPGSSDGLDIDAYDPHCEHLIVRTGLKGKVIGTYRALTPSKASILGALYSESEFDLSALSTLRPKMLEVGRSCVHRDYRSGGSIMALWSGLGAFMELHGYEYLLGCASVPMLDDGQYAYSLYRQFSEQGLLSEDYIVKPRIGLRESDLQILTNVKPPPLLKGYLRLGAKICGPPAIDAQFKTADFLTLLCIKDLNPRYARHFLSAEHL